MPEARDLTINEVIAPNGDVDRDALGAHIPDDVEGDQREAAIDRLEVAVRSYQGFAMTPGRDPVELAGFLTAPAVSAPDRNGGDGEDQ